MPPPKALPGTSDEIPYIYKRVLKSKSEYADKTIMATCILHNLIRENSFTNGQSQSDGSNSLLNNMRRQGGCADGRALETRDHFKNSFSTAQRTLLWL